MSYLPPKIREWLENGARATGTRFDAESCECIIAYLRGIEAENAQLRQIAIPQGTIKIVGDWSSEELVQLMESMRDGTFTIAPNTDALSSVSKPDETTNCSPPHIENKGQPDEFV